MSDNESSSETRSVLGSAGYYEKSIDSLPAARAVETAQQEVSSQNPGGTVTLIESFSGAVGLNATGGQKFGTVHYSGRDGQSGDLIPGRETIGHLTPIFGRGQ
jgi:hypothetical protein